LPASAPRPTGTTLGRGAAIRWAPLFCFLLLVGASAANDWTTPAQMAFAHSLGGTIKAGITSADIGGIVAAALALAAYVFLYVVAQPLALFAVFLAVEVMLAGPPKSWRLAGNALWLRVGLAFAYLLIRPGEAYVFAHWHFGPLLTLDQGRFPAWAGPGIGLLLALASACTINFGQYWIHRLQHAVPLLWRFHSVHHSIEDLDSLNSYLHPVDTWGQIAFTLIVTGLIGFQFDTTVWLLAFENIYDRLQHTRAPINFGPLGRLLVDNRYYFLHHSVRPEDYACNFSALFTCWDHLFGTYRKPHPTILATTGTIDKLPSRTLAQLFLARLEDKAPSKPPGAGAQSRPPSSAGQASRLSPKAQNRA